MPTLIKNIVFCGLSIPIEEGLYFEYISIMDNPFVWIVFGLNITLSFFLITLFNEQAQIENSYDQNGMEDIKLEGYEMDYHAQI